MTRAGRRCAAGAGEPYRWLTEATKHGTQAHSTLLDVAEARPPADVSAALNLAEGETALPRHQVLSIDGEPVELVKSYYPMAIAQGTVITDKRKIRGGTPTSSPNSAAPRASAWTESPPESPPKSSTRP